MSNFFKHGSDKGSAAGKNWPSHSRPPRQLKHADFYFKIINIALVIASSLPLCYAMFLFIKKIPLGNNVMWCVPLSLIFMTGMAVIKTRIPFSVFEYIPIVLLTLSLIEFFRLGFADGFSAVWIFTIPPLVYFTMGRRNGVIFSLVIFAVVLFMLLYPGFPRYYYYSNQKLIRIVLVYLLVFIIIHLYETARILKEKSLEKLNKIIKSERDIFVVMKDNLKTGLFLMDENLIMRDNYSCLLESIFGVSDLGGRKFTNLLETSLTSAEIATIGDFFDMVRERRFDAEMLEDINPIKELKYTDANGKDKILHCTFVPMDDISGNTIIMGNIEDATAKVELENQVKLGEIKRREEMDVLFEVLQIDPNVFNDFIDDTEYEFGVINDILKNQKISSSDALVSVFQSIHAIKANAIIVGLNSYSKKLHDVETYVKELQGKAEVTFDDMLTLTVRIDEIMSEKDNLKASVQKINSFNSGGAKKSNAGILIEELERAASRTAADTGKKVRLNTSGIDSAVLDMIPRRAVKEILLQLVRNAVFHGIESPEERIEKGKKETGRIAVSLKMKDGRAHITLGDDGKGLDVEKIKERAKRMYIIKKDEDLKDKNRVLQVIFMPGFSTAEDEGLHAGRGVGLNLVQARVKEYGGTVRIQSELNKGSAFHISLPVEKPATKKAAEDGTA
ncbi:MAG: hypothetical protein LBH18_04840 [Spirochaetaceae bacterium]|jgi:two-component system chemotaxis sensor kinase CheA|nr:hypothetical protein [Spirochaetaceae bacterium]